MYHASTCQNEWLVITRRLRDACFKSPARQFTPGRNVPYEVTRNHLRTEYPYGLHSYHCSFLSPPWRQNPKTCIFDHDSLLPEQPNWFAFFFIDPWHLFHQATCVSAVAVAVCRDSISVLDSVLYGSNLSSTRTLTTALCGIGAAHCGFVPWAATVHVACAWLFYQNCMQRVDKYGYEPMCSAAYGRAHFNFGENSQAKILNEGQMAWLQFGRKEPGSKWVWRQGYWLGGDCSIIEKHHLPEMMHNVMPSRPNGDIAIVPNWPPDGSTSNLILDFEMRIITRISHIGT